MDMTRYYVPQKTRRESLKEREGKHKAATSRFLPKNDAKSYLPTPQAFFEKQRQFKEADRQAMMRFAKKKVVKHNLKLRRKQLKEAEERKIEELRQVRRTRLPSSPRPPIPKKKISRDLVSEPDKKSEEEIEEEDVDEYNGAEFNKLKKAIKEKDEYEINRSILINFFELKDPDRIPEVDEMLRTHKGQELELFDEITKVYKVVRETGRSRARKANFRKSRNISFDTRAPSATFVEGNVEEAANADIRSSARSAISHSRMKRGMKKIPSALTIQSNGSVISIDSVLSVSSAVEGVKEFQKALDKEIKAKKHKGEFVTKMKEKGGQWWVNRSPPKVHPSQRRRNTLLDELRKGNVPISEI